MLQIFTCGTRLLTFFLREGLSVPGDVFSGCFDGCVSFDFGVSTSLGSAESVSLTVSFGVSLGASVVGCLGVSSLGLFNFVSTTFGISSDGFWAGLVTLLRVGVGSSTDSDISETTLLTDSRLLSAVGLVSEGLRTPGVFFSGSYIIDTYVIWQRTVTTINMHTYITKMNLILR